MRDQIDRATLRLTGTYRVIPRLSLGVEVNPKADDANPLVNWLAVSETRLRPALMFGLSSDRIGTPSGHAYYFTLSKDIENLTGLPIAPYIGGAYGTFEDELRFIGGVRVRGPRGFAGGVIHDGKAAHPNVEYRFLDRHVVSLLWVDTEDVGAAYSVAF